MQNIGEEVHIHQYFFHCFGEIFYWHIGTIIIQFIPILNIPGRQNQQTVQSFNITKMCIRLIVLDGFKLLRVTTTVNYTRA